MNKPALLLATSLLLSAALSHALVVIETTMVGDPGNAADTTGLGAVGYSYHIGTYEVTNAQYAAFLNAVAQTDTHLLYYPSMGSSERGGILQQGSSGSYSYVVKPGYANKPVNHVSFNDAARFANWMTNGQPSGAQDNTTTESGIYPMGGVTNPPTLSVVRNAAAWNAGGVAITNLNEWYKAAYFSAALNAGTGGYFTYPTSSNTAPTASFPTANPNSANYNKLIPYPEITDVGSYTGSASPYGTFDQGGNVREWIEEPNSGARTVIGGSYFNSPAPLAAGYDAYMASSSHEPTLGFRVISLQPIPEPATVGAVFGILALSGVLARKRITTKTRASQR